MLIPGNGFQRISKIKLLLAWSLNKLLILDFLILISRYLFKNSVRVISYHDIHYDDRINFEMHIDFYRKNYCILNPDELEDYFSGKFKTNKQGLIITFDDGLISQYLYGHILLKKKNIEAIYFIPYDFIDSAENGGSFLYADLNNIEYYANKNTSVAMNWQQVRELRFVGSHTMTHRRMSSALSSDEMIYEIVCSKNKIEKKLGRNITDFCWVGGEDATYIKAAFTIVKDSGYARIYTTNNSLLNKNSDRNFINRNNVESCYPIYLMKFQISGIVDVLYMRKRNIIHTRLKDEC